MAVIVDDCCISGARVRRFLADLPFERLILGFLFAVPETLRGILAQDQRVSKCVSAFELTDRAPEMFDDPSQYGAWQTRWRERLPERYFIGFPERIYLPWSEPDFLQWNVESGEIEPGWRTAPPSACLKNWAALDLPPKVVDKPAYRLGDHIAYRILDDEIQLLHQGDGRIYSLKHTARDMWRALVGYGDLRAAVEHMRTRYEASYDVLFYPGPGWSSHTCAWPSLDP